MSEGNKKRIKLIKSLRRAQDDHRTSLRKVEKARAKFEKRKRKLYALEGKIADLERSSSEWLRSKASRSELHRDYLRRARLIVNPDAKSDQVDTSQRLVQIVSQLREHGIVAGIGLKTSGKAARDLAKEAVENGDDLVIVVGGDGTIEDVASELVGSKTTLGIIPIGTMNNIARSLGIPLNIEDACSLLGMGVTRRIDVGRVAADEKANVEYFLEAAGVGLSGIALPLGHALEKGQWDVLPSVVRRLFDSQPEPIDVKIDDEVIHAKSQVVTISNAPLTGWNLLVAPTAKMDDGWLDVAVYDGMTKTDLLMHFKSAANGANELDPNVKFYRARRVRISSAQKLEVNSDKDSIPEKRVLDIKIVPLALSVIVGKGIGLSLPVEAVPAVPPLKGTPDERSENANNGRNGNGAKQVVEQPSS